MATRAASRRELPVLTGDGTDGFPSEAAYEEQIEEYLEGLNEKKRAKALMTRDMYAAILTILLDPNSTAQGTAQFRFWAKRMFRLVVTPTANLVAHENRPVAVKDQIYAILVGTHGDSNHGGRDKTSAQVRRFYSWLPKELVSRFVRVCPTCIAKRRASQPSLSDAFIPGNLPRLPRRVRVKKAVPSTTEESDDDTADRFEAYAFRPSSSLSGAAGSRGSQSPVEQPDENPYALPAPIQHYDPAIAQQQVFDGYPQLVQDAYPDNSAFDQTYTTYYHQETYDATVPHLDQDEYGLQAKAEPNVYHDENLAPQPVYQEQAHDGTSIAAQFQAYGGWQLAPEQDNDDGVVPPNEPLASQPLLPLPPLPQPAEQYAVVDQYAATNQYAPVDQYPSADQYEPVAQYEAVEAGEQYDPSQQQYDQSAPAIIEPAQEETEQWREGQLVEEPTSSASAAFHISNIPTISAPPAASPCSTRRAKPPPLNLGRSSNLFPTTFTQPEFRRSATTGVPQLLSPSYRPESVTAPLSAPLQRAFTDYSQYRDAQISPGLTSACSTASTAFSSIGGYPLTPGTSVDSIGSAGVCPANTEWRQQQDPNQVDETIRLLFDSANLAVPPSAVSAYFVESEQQQYAHALDMAGPDASNEFVNMLQTVSPARGEHTIPPSPSRRPSDRPRLRNASSSHGLSAASDHGTPSKPGRRVVSAAGPAAGGHTLTRTPTKEQLRYMPY
ncbi:hypothetical protein JCM11641_005361 [Rhodosporidiobolus odoratus]